MYILHYFIIIHYFALNFIDNIGTVQMIRQSRTFLILKILYISNLVPWLLSSDYKANNYYILLIYKDTFLI